FKKTIAALSGLFFSLAIFAQQQQGTPKPEEQDSIMSNGMFLVMLAIVVILLFVIVGMSEVVKAGAMKQVLKTRTEKEKTGNSGKIISTVIFLLFTASLFGEDVQPVKTPEPDFTYWGMGAGIFYVMLCVIFFEIIFIYLLYRMGMMLLDRDEMKAKLYGERQAEKLVESKLMKSLTDAVPVEEEAAIMMDHDYDGIRELDNNLPPWWKYGFYLTICVAVVYLFHFH